jgi:hypothetical protein
MSFVPVTAGGKLQRKRFDELMQEDSIDTVAESKAAFKTGAMSQRPRKNDGNASTYMAGFTTP